MISNISLPENEYSKGFYRLNSSLVQNIQMMHIPQIKKFFTEEYSYYNKFIMDIFICSNLLYLVHLFYPKFFNNPSAENKNKFLKDNFLILSEIRIPRTNKPFPLLTFPIEPHDLATNPPAYCKMKKCLRQHKEYQKQPKNKTKQKKKKK